MKLRKAISVENSNQEDKKKTSKKIKRSNNRKKMNFVSNESVLEALNRSSNQPLTMEEKRKGGK